MGGRGSLQGLYYFHQRRPLTKISADNNNNNTHKKVISHSLCSETGTGAEAAVRENRAGVSLRGQAGTEARTEGEWVGTRGKRRAFEEEIFLAKQQPENFLNLNITSA